MMVGGGIAAIVALATVGLALIALIVVAFFSRRLAGIGFIVLLVWLFYPIVAFHVSYKVTTLLSPYDHERELKGGSYGVTLPPDGTLTRLPRHWSDDPAGPLSFATQPEGYESGTSFRIIRILADPQTREEDLPSMFDWSDCTATDTVHGLQYFAPQSCPVPVDANYRTFGGNHVFLTPTNAPYKAVFSVPSFRDPEEMGAIYAQIGPFGIIASGRKQPISQWRIPLNHIARQLEAHFTLIPDASG